MVQGKDTLNNNKIHPWRSWCHRLLFFLHRFLRSVLLLRFHHSGKIAIPNDIVFFFLQIIHLVLLKLPQRQGDLGISGYIHVLLWWARYGNLRLSFLRRSDLPFVQNRFVAIYFRPIFDRQFQKVILLVLQQCGEDSVIIGVRWNFFEISGCAIDLVDGGQCKCKRKRWFVFYAFLWTCQETDYFRLSCELVGWLTISKYQGLEIFYCSHVGAVKGVVGEGKSVSWGGALTKGEVHKR